jgi:hypothetical protein
MTYQKKHTNTLNRRKGILQGRVKCVGQVDQLETQVDGTNACVKNTTKKQSKPKSKIYFKNIKNIIEKHETFLKSVSLTSVFLNVFYGNPDQFFLLFDDEVKRNYQFISNDIPEHVAESIDEMCYDMAFNFKNFSICNNGTFEYISFLKKGKMKASIDEIICSMIPYMGHEWKI